VQNGKIGTHSPSPAAHTHAPDIGVETIEAYITNHRAFIDTHKLTLIKTKKKIRKYNVKIRVWEEELERRGRREKQKREEIIAKELAREEQRHLERIKKIREKRGAEGLLVEGDEDEESFVIPPSKKQKR
jgi:hypothetical protein